MFYPPWSSSKPAGDKNDIDIAMRRLTRRSLSVGAIAALLGAGGARWIATRPEDDGIAWPLRRVLQWNERLAASLSDPTHLAPEFPRAMASEPRVNGRVGLRDQRNVPHDIIEVTGAAEQRVPLTAVRQLPHYEMTTEFKCVEGWSRVIHWKGVRLADFLEKYGRPSQYVALSTPFGRVDDRGREDRYYVGLDHATALHPQTLLCFEMNGQPLTEGHGAPLRLVSTVKYGYKCIKRIGRIELTNDRPPDYWAKRGYDWYGGL